MKYDEELQYQIDRICYIYYLEPGLLINLYITKIKNL